MARNIPERACVHAGMPRDRWQRQPSEANVRPVTSDPNAELTMPDGPAPPKVGKLFAGRYEIQALLGRGGMGSVYRAYDRAVDDLVALKTLDVQDDDELAVERFRREVRLARRVTHRNAARTFDLGEHGSVRYLTMEHVDGQSLRAWLAKRPTAISAIDIALQVAAGLAAAHEAGVIHRDLKPSNIMLENAAGEGPVRVVITDFGIARMSEDGRGQTGGLIGTPAYMAPEQVEGKPLDGRADLYALALMLAEMLSGKLPFAGDNAFALAMARLRVEVPDLSAGHPIPAPLLAVLERALQRDPQRRFPNAIAFAQALAQARERLLEEPMIGESSESGESSEVVESPLLAAHPTQTTVPRSETDEPGIHPVAPVTPTPPVFATRTLTETTTDRTGLRVPAATVTPSPRVVGKALAVLPFRYRGPAESEFVADALLDELTDLLSMTRGLKVSSSGATAKLTRDGDRDPRTLGRTLGVDVVVDGSIQLSGQRLRIAARLLDVDSGFQLWNERFDGQLADVFDLQDKLGKRVAEALRVELEIIEHRELADVEAIESYLRARHAKVRWHLQGPQGAIAHYRAVLERAPGFKPAIAGLAIACMRAWFSPEQEDEHVDWQATAKAAVEHAMAEAPEFAETRIAAASWAVQGGFYRDAGEHLREALRIAPTCALAHEYLGRLQLEAAHPDRGVAHVELAYELDPGLDWCLADLARHKALRGDYDGFDQLMRQLLEKSEQHRASALLMNMRIGAWRRDLTRIRTAYEQLSNEASDESTRAILSYGTVLLQPFDREKLERHHAKSLASIQNGRFHTLMLQLFAEQTAFHGDYEWALIYLRDAVQLVLVDLDWLDHCPLFDPLRRDPRFIELRGKIRARCEQIWALG
jgi:serine/threonine protein kinase/TolB-like protein